VKIKIKSPLKHISYSFVCVLAIDTIDRGQVIPLKTIKLVFDASPPSTQQ